MNTLSTNIAFVVKRIKKNISKRVPRQDDSDKTSENGPMLDSSSENGLCRLGIQTQLVRADKDRILSNIFVLINKERQKMLNKLILGA